jgi:GDP-L-fucose synthase
MAREVDFGEYLPQDAYGLSRYIMSNIAEKSGNIYNLRLFGCYGHGDPPFKLIPYILHCIHENKPIELRQNTLFDFLYVMDIVPVIMHFIENEPMNKAYNLCSGVPILIGDIAVEVRRKMKSGVPIVFKQAGYGLEYTGNNERLRSEIQNWVPRSIGEGVKEIIDYENR